jgi:GT2 family glycosyltransferase
MASKLAIAILNYRTADLTVGCLESVAIAIGGLPHVKVVVADNNSEDGSVGRISQVVRDRNWGAWASVLALPTNGGFSIGNNAAIRTLSSEAGKPDFFLLLNPDTVLRPGAIQPLVAFLNDHPSVGVVGSRLEDPDGTSQHSAFRFPSILGEFETQLQLGFFARLVGSRVIYPTIPDQPQQVDWVAGASVLVRRKVFEDLGLFDEGFFLYFEDADFCLRAMRAGWPCWYVPQSRVVHLVGQATGMTNKRDTSHRLPGYFFDSRRRYFIKNHGKLYAIGVDVVWVLGHVLWQIRRWFQKKPDVWPTALLSDYVRNSVFVRGFRL